MKKVLFGLFISFVLSLNVFAEEIYEMSRIDLGDTGYEPIILEEKLYLIGDDYDCSGTNCNLYFINEKNEIEKANKRHYLTGSEPPIKSYYLDFKKNEDGAYGLISCSNYDELCKKIEGTDISALYLSKEKYTDTKESNVYIAEGSFYIVKSKDNFVAIYDGQGNKIFDFGNYEILGNIDYSDDGINANVEKIVLKDKSNEAYYFIGAQNKVVTLTKEVADKIGINDENVSTIKYEIDKYYSFIENYKTLFFTINDGLLKSKSPLEGLASIKRYNNQYIIEEKILMDGFPGDFTNLYKIDGTPILEPNNYQELYYDVDKKFILGVKCTEFYSFWKRQFNIEVFDGENIILSKELIAGEQVIDAIIDNDGNLWVLTDNDGNISTNGKLAINILKKKSSEPTPEPEPTPEKDSEPEENNSCKVVDGKYYDKNGKETTKEQHEKECLENPDTGYVIPFVGLLILTASFIIIKNKKQLLKKI